MKKTIITILTICMICLVLCACGQQEATESDNISYRQQSLYCGKTPNFTVRLVTGDSEALFVADGVAGDVAPFVTLTLVPQHVDLFNDEYTFTLTGTTGEVQGQLLKDSFGASYTADVSDYRTVGVPQSVKVTSGNTQDIIALQDKMQGAIEADKAIQVAKDAVQDKLSADAKQREVYVKYINDTAEADSPYYWYVAFIAAPNDYYAVLVDNEGNVISVNP